MIVNIEKCLYQFLGFKKKKVSVDGYAQKLIQFMNFLEIIIIGNPLTRNPNEINHKNKKTMKELYEATLYKIKCLQESGYNLIYIWENDYKLNKKLI